MIINLTYLIQYFFGRKEDINYSIGEESKLYDTASIINNLGNDRVQIGQHSHIRGQLLTFGHGGRIEIGDYSYVGFNSYIWSAKHIGIGNRVLISHNCNIFDNDIHPLDPVKRHLQFRKIITTGQPKKINLEEKEIIIEDDVLIGANATVLKGVKLGRGAIVGAGSVVVDDVAPLTLVLGNPAKKVRNIYSK